MENKIYHHPFCGEMYYTLHLPENLKGQQNIPMLVFLHGSGERGRNHDKLCRVAVPRYLREGLEIPALVLCPQCPDEFIWDHLIFVVKDLIEEIIETYKVDRSRVSLTGISMGGYGTWAIASTFPEMFRRIAPVCGGGIGWRAAEIRAEVHAFHGDMDTAVLPARSYEMVDALRAAGKPAKLTIFHGVGHNSWDEAYQTTNVLEWLVS